MISCLYEGQVRHRRHAPLQHAFSHRLFMLYLDLDELPEVFRGRWLWSLERFNIASFRRRDYLGDPAVALKDAVCDRVEQHSGTRPHGPVRMLTHLRYWGYCFNPVTFYFCYDEAGRGVEAVITEITNTPWKERHAYVLTRQQNRGSRSQQRFCFDKAFHISPFMDMNQRYDWRLAEPGSKLSVRMDSFENGSRMFDATLTMRRRPLTGRRLAGALLRHPFMTAQVSTAIYWQALRLRCKGAPFHAHPSKRMQPQQVES